jgi:hypothetical protein
VAALVVAAVMAVLLLQEVLELLGKAMLEVLVRPLFTAVTAAALALLVALGQVAQVLAVV